MLAFYVDGSEVKAFMHILLKTNAFDTFELRKINLTTITDIYIEGNLNKDFFEEPPNRIYCIWQEIRPIIFELIKGSKTPKNMKIVLAASKEKLSEIHPNLGSGFINIVFENGIVTFTTGSSQKNFSVDKTPEQMWNAYTTEFFKNLGLSFTKIE